MESTERDNLSSRVVEPSKKVPKENQPGDLDAYQRRELEKSGESIRQSYHKPLWELDFYPGNKPHTKEFGNNRIVNALRQGAVLTAGNDIVPLETVGDLITLPSERDIYRSGNWKRVDLNKVIAALDRMNLKIGMDPVVVAHALSGDRPASDGNGRAFQQQADFAPAGYRTLDDPTIIHDQLLPTGTLFTFASKTIAIEFLQSAKKAFAEASGPHRTDQGDIDASYRNAIKLLPDNSVYISDAALPAVARADIATMITPRAKAR